MKASLLVVVVLGLLGAFLAARTTKAPPSKEPVAIVSGRTIYEDDLTQLLGGKLRRLRNEEYQLKKEALQHLVDQEVVKAEAKKEGLSMQDLLKREVDARVPDPAPEEIQAFYDGHKAELREPLEALKDRIQASLKQDKTQQALQQYIQDLRQRPNVTILLQPPRVDVSFDPARLRGNAKAPVKIVEFSDFQCPYCGTVQPTLKELLAKYSDRVSLSFRDYPAPQLHPQAQGAAEASRCAGEQGKFWEYHDALFSNQDKLDRKSLTGFANNLHLDEKKFDSCVSSGKYKPQIGTDVYDGTRAGVGGTPGFFINGIFLNGAQPQAEFEKIIDRELSDKRKSWLGH